MALLSRPPVITVLGHVDHGKTSLLDRIRKANVAAKELGGITQAIGAYQIDHQGQKITFIDTPGHAAFSAMRARGGGVADIAILIVAADDGVMPQTKESIDHIKAAGIPYVVAVNKVDLPQANVMKVKSDLAEVGEYVEGYGGNIPMVEISAKTGQGIDNLIETLLLLAQLEELKDTSNLQLSSVVIESQLHPNKGPVATLLVQEGQLKIKDELYVGSKKMGRVRSMNLASGESTILATPSTPIQVMGLEEVPSVGDIVTTRPVESESKQKPDKSSSTLLDTNRPNIMVKADVAGSLEAILGSMPDVVNVVGSSVGGVTESDIQTASASHATIICFNIKAAGTVSRLAEIENVQIVSFGIIYELFDYVKEIAEKANQEELQKILGEAKVLQTFPFDDKIVYGCLVTSGRLKVGDLVGNSKIISIRIGKETTREAKKDSECGIILEPALDYQIGDVIIAHK